jgi:hypothetical protein
MTLREREDHIFQKYRGLGCKIIPDGALGIDYETAHRRLLVILKEPNDANGKFCEEGGDIRDFGKKYDRPATWNNLARWSALVDDPSLNINQIDVSETEKRLNHLRRIAVVNLKKTPGKSTAHYREIKAIAEQHAELLREQFRLYKPDVTIAGGVFSIVRELMGRTEQRDPPNCFSYFEDEDLGVCIDFYHPQQRTYSKEDLFKFLRCQLTYHGFTR